MSDERKVIVANLQHAIQTMRDACDEAERRLNATQKVNNLAPSQVLHALTWGQANAVNYIESALSYIDDVRGSEHDLSSFP